MVLAKEVGLCYAAIALVTDYDSWRDVGNSVNVGDVLTSFRENVKKVTELIIKSVVEIAKLDWDETIDSLQVRFIFCYSAESVPFVVGTYKYHPSCKYFGLIYFPFLFQVVVRNNTM